MDNRLALARHVLREAEHRAGVRSSVCAPKYDVPAYLARIFPQGITRGTVVEIADSPSVSLLIAGIAAQQGAWVAGVGVSQWSWDCARISGIDLERCAIIPQVPQASAQILATVVEGFDVVIAPSSLITYQHQRVIERKVRTRAGIFLSLGSWQGSNNYLSGELEQLHATAWEHCITMPEVGPISQLDYSISSRWGSTRVSFSPQGWGPA